MEDGASGQPSDTPWSRLTDGARTWDAGAGTPDSTVSPDLRRSRHTVSFSTAWILSLSPSGLAPR